MIAVGKPLKDDASFPHILAGESRLIGKLNSLLIKYGGLYWGIQDRSGTTITSKNTALDEGRNIVLTANFAADTNWTKGAGWSIGAGVATKVAGAATDLEQTIPIQAGVSYKVTFTMTVTAGTLTPKVGGTSGTTRSTADTFTETIVAGSGSSLIEFSADAAFAGTVDDVSVTWLNIPVNYSSFYGTYQNVTLNQSGPDSIKSGQWGATSYGKVLTNVLSSFFAPSAGTMLLFPKVSSSAVFSDGLLHRLFYFLAGTKHIRMYLNNTNFIFQCNFGGGDVTVIKGGVSTTNWFLPAMTWDTSANQFKAYWNGVQEGATQALADDWLEGNFGYATIGASDTVPTNPWSGYIGPGVLLRGVASVTELAEVYSLI